MLVNIDLKVTIIIIILNYFLPHSHLEKSLKNVLLT
jgi:hypothetical protein